MALSCCKKESALFCKITSKNDGDFYCLSSFHSFSIENNKYFNKYLIERFVNSYEFCDGDVNTFCLMLRKGVVYLYKYMDSSKRFDETLPKKEDFYSNLNMEDIIDADYKHTKKVWKTLK